MSIKGSLIILSSSRLNLFLSSPGHHKKKNNKTLPKKRNNPLKSAVLRMKQGVICMSRSFPLLLLFRHAPDRKCENLVSQSKEKLPPLEMSLPAPKRQGTPPLGSWESPAVWHWLFFSSGDHLRFALSPLGSGFVQRINWNRGGKQAYICYPDGYTSALFHRDDFFDTDDS